MKVSTAWRACLHGKRFSLIWLFVTLWIVDCQAPLSMGFSSQEYRTELLCLSPKDLPDSGIEPMFPAAPAALQVNSLLRATREAPIPWQMPNKHEFPVTCCSVQSLSRVRLFATPWTAARQASLSITNSQSLLKLMSIESVMPSSHFIFCRPLLLLPPIPPSISLFQWVNSSHEVAKVLEFQL